MTIGSGPVQSAVRRKLSAEDKLRTPSGRASFTIRKIDTNRILLRVGGSESPMSFTWDELEDVVHFLKRHGGEARIGAVKSSDVIPGTLDEYLKKTQPVMRANYAAAILEYAGVVEYFVPERARYVRLVCIDQESPAFNGNLRRTIHAAIFKGDRCFVADCLEIPVVTQGQTVDETLYNLRKAVELHMEDEDLDEVGLIRNPTISVTLELEPVHGST